MLGDGVAPFEVAQEVLAALAEGRVADVVALCDPGVVCMPVARPALSVYAGHAGMAALTADLHAVWGRYRVKVEEAVAVAGAGDGGERVTVRVQVVEAGRGEGLWPPVLAEFTVHGGLVTRIESSYEFDT